MQKSFEYIKEISASVAVLIALLGYYTYGRDFFYPNMLVCKETVAKLKIKKVEFEGTNFFLIKDELVAETNSLIQKYYQLENSCKDPIADEYIKTIKNKLFDIISEDFKTLSNEYSESLENRLYSHLNLFDFICRSINCTEQEMQVLKNCKEILK
jgi:hypothetical protein